jgi:hypothetical protein
MSINKIHTLVKERPNKSKKLPFVDDKMKYGHNLCIDLKTFQRQLFECLENEAVTSRFSNLNHAKSSNVITNNILEVRFEVLTAVSDNITVCWDVTLCNWLNRYCSAGSGCIHLQSSNLKIKATSSSETDNYLVNSKAYDLRKI